MSEQTNNSEIHTAAVAHALKGEGATNVWADAMRGVHREKNHRVGLQVVHASIISDGAEQPMAGNQNYDRFISDGIPINALDRHDDGSGTLPVYSEQDLEELTRSVKGKDAVTTLEEYPIVSALNALDKRDLPPIVPNLYRAADGGFKTPEHLKALRDGFADGSIVHATVDAYASRDAYGRHGISPENITVIPNGIDTETFKPDDSRREAIRRELDISADAPTVLLIGRDSPEKDIPLFLESARIYLEKNPDAHVVMAGTGLTLNNPNIAGLVNNDFSEASELTKRLHLLGARRDIPALYNAGDVLALTSATESRPLCISEAQASGLGVTVSTNVGDAPVMIGEHGFITGRDPAEIAARWSEAYQRRNEIGFPIERREELGTKPMIAEYDRVIRNVVK